MEPTIVKFSSGEYGLRRSNQFGMNINSFINLRTLRHTLKIKTEDNATFECRCKSIEQAQEVFDLFEMAQDQGAHV